MTNIKFLEIDSEKIIAEIKEEYEKLSGKILYPAQVEQLLLNAFAYREYLLRVQIQEVATQNLVAFSRAPFLDYLGQLVGVRRLSASKAVCQIKLTFVSEHGDLTIPKDTRVQSIDGEAVFLLDEEISVKADTNEVLANFTCTIEGKKANGYPRGKIAVILDPQPYLISAENIEITSGGSDEETDEELRNRIMIAPQSFSNAGSKRAYEFFARSANADISEVGITSPKPGQVNIYPLMRDGKIPNKAVLDAVFQACNDEKIRPLTDTVIVEAPEAIYFNIEVDLVLITGSVQSETLKAVENNLHKYTVNKGNKLGLDIVLEKIISECMKIESVYDVKVNEPKKTIVINNNQVAKCKEIKINLKGYNDE